MELKYHADFRPIDDDSVVRDWFQATASNSSAPVRIAQSTMLEHEDLLRRTIASALLGEGSMKSSGPLSFGIAVLERNSAADQCVPTEVDMQSDVNVISAEYVLSATRNEKVKGSQTLSSIYDSAVAWLSSLSCSHGTQPNMSSLVRLVEPTAEESGLEDARGYVLLTAKSVSRILTHLGQEATRDNDHDASGGNVMLQCRILLEDVVSSTYEVLREYVHCQPPLRDVFAAVHAWAVTHRLVVRHDVAEQQLIELKKTMSLGSRLMEDLSYRSLHPVALYTLVITVLVREQELRPQGLLASERTAVHYYLETVVRQHGGTDPQRSQEITNEQREWERFVSNASSLSADAAPYYPHAQAPLQAQNHTCPSQAPLPEHHPHVAQKGNSWQWLYKVLAFLAAQVSAGDVLAVDAESSARFKLHADRRKPLVLLAPFLLPPHPESLNDSAAFRGFLRQFCLVNFFALVDKKQVEHLRRMAKGTLVLFEKSALCLPAPSEKIVSQLPTEITSVSDDDERHWAVVSGLQRILEDQDCLAAIRNASACARCFETLSYRPSKSSGRLPLCPVCFVKEGEQAQQQRQPSARGRGGQRGRGRGLGAGVTVPNAHYDNGEPADTMTGMNDSGICFGCDTHVPYLKGKPLEVMCNRCNF